MDANRITVTTALLSLIVATGLAADVEVELRPLAGESAMVRLTGLSAKQVTVEVAGESRDFPTAKLMWIQGPGIAPADKATIWIDLVDGSKLAANSFATTQGVARIGLAGHAPLQIPTRSIHTVRFRQQTPELAASWREVTFTQATSDMIVTRKTSVRTIEQGENEPRTVTEQALDQLEGTLLDITDDSVRFEVDGEKVPIRREKLEGLVYYHPAKRQFSPPVCRLTEAGGSVWVLSDVSLDGGRISATTTGNVRADVPVTAMTKLDFSVGNVAFLSDLEADSGAGEGAFSLQPPAMSHKFNSVFQVRSRPPLGADGFRIAGKRYDNGLSMHSPARLVYRVPEGFRKFLATAGVDDSVVAPGRFDLVILGDGKELARHAILPDERRQAIPLDFDVSQIKRLTILLDPTDGQDIGDQLDLCEARFTK